MILYDRTYLYTFHDETPLWRSFVVDHDALRSGVVFLGVTRNWYSMIHQVMMVRDAVPLLTTKVPVVAQLTTMPLNLRSIPLGARQHSQTGRLRHILAAASAAASGTSVSAMTSPIVIGETPWTYSNLIS